MSNSADDVCGLSEVIETEHVMEIMEENQFLDLAASMETRGEIAVSSSSSLCSPHEERQTERGQLAGQKRKRGGYEVMEDASLFSLPLPTAIVSPSPRHVIATPLPSQSPLVTPLPHQSTSSPQLQDPSHTSALPAVNIQLTSDELQALIGILRQRGSAPHPHPPTITSTSSPSSQLHQPIAPKNQVTAVVIPSSSSSLSLPSLPSSFSSSSSRAVVEAQAVVAAKASVQGKTRHCSCRNSQCLKLYCDCFSHEESCSVECSCRNCRNNPAFSEMRELTLKMYKGRDPTAFHHSDKGEEEGHRSKGCKCRKTLCLKKYCECFHSGVPCTSLCRCIGCKNTATPPPDSQSHPPPSTSPLLTPSTTTTAAMHQPPHTLQYSRDDPHTPHTLPCTISCGSSTDIPSTGVGCTSELEHTVLTSSSLLNSATNTKPRQLSHTHVSNIS